MMFIEDSQVQWIKRLIRDQTFTWIDALIALFIMVTRVIMSIRVEDQFFLGFLVAALLGLFAGRRRTVIRLPRPDGPAPPTR
jgi:hypothetical protein